MEEPNIPDSPAGYRESSKYSADIRKTDTDGDRREQRVITVPAG
jgi:hypothetical protein